MNKEIRIKLILQILLLSIISSGVLAEFEPLKEVNNKSVVSKNNKSKEARVEAGKFIIRGDSTNMEMMILDFLDIHYNGSSCSEAKSQYRYHHAKIFEVFEECGIIKCDQEARVQSRGGNTKPRTERVKDIFNELNKNVGAGTSRKTKRPKLNFIPSTEIKGSIAEKYNWFSFETPSDSIHKLDKHATEMAMSCANRKLQMIDPNILVEPVFEVEKFNNDTYFPPTSGAWGQESSNLWGLEKLDVEQAWQVSRGAGVKVAVLDTGVDYNHPDLAGQVLFELGYDFINHTEDSMDHNGHGTHVAGTIAALSNNSIGIAGVAPDSKIIPIKVLNRFGSGNSAGIAEGIVHAVDMGADVINMSLGGHSFYYDVPKYYDDALNYARNNKVVLVAAAGNSGSNALEISPANHPAVIAVAATDEEDQSAFFSSYGNIVAMSAPGGGDSDCFENDEDSDFGIERCNSSILSLISAENGLPDDSPLLVSNGYARFNGTSMAAPHVSGVVALLKGRDPNVSGSAIRNNLQRTADPSTYLYNRKIPGRINARRALNFGTPNFDLSSVEIDNDLNLVFSGKVGYTPVQSWKIFRQYYDLDSNNHAWAHIYTGTGIMDGVIHSVPVRSIIDHLYRGMIFKLIGYDADGEEILSRAISLRDSLHLVVRQVNGVPNDGNTLIQNQPGIIEFVGDFLQETNSTPLELQVYTSYGVEENVTISYPNGQRAPIISDTLATLDTSNLTDGIYTVSLKWLDYIGGCVGPPFQCTSDVYYKLIIDRNIDAVSSAVSDASMINGQVSLSEYGPSIFDINQDGTDDLVYSGYHAMEAINFSQSGISSISGWPSRNLKTLFDVSFRVFDLDGDLTYEIVKGDYLPSVKIVSNNAVLLDDGSDLSNLSLYYQGLAIDDIDDNGFANIVINGPNHIYNLEYDGNWSTKFISLVALPNTLNAGIMHDNVYIVDLDGDGDKEIITSYLKFESANYDNVNHIVVLDKYGTILHDTPLINTRTSASNSIMEIPSCSYKGCNMIFADIDGDGDMEIFVSEGGAIMAYKHDMSSLAGWPLATNGQTKALAAGYINSDNKADLVIERSDIYDNPGSNNADQQPISRLSVDVLTFDGSSLPGFPRVLDSLVSHFNPNQKNHERELKSVRVADLNGDKNQDILLHYQSRSGLMSRLLAVTGRGMPINTINFPYSYINPPVIGDIDGDAKLEIAQVDFNSNAVVLWDLSSSALTYSDWPMDGADANRSFVLKANKAPLMRIISPSTNDIIQTRIFDLEVNIADEYEQLRSLKVYLGDNLVRNILNPDIGVLRVESLSSPNKRSEILSVVASDIHDVQTKISVELKFKKALKEVIKAGAALNSNEGSFNSQ